MIELLGIRFSQCMSQLCFRVNPPQMDDLIMPLRIFYTHQVSRVLSSSVCNRSYAFLESEMAPPTTVFTVASMSNTSKGGPNSSPHWYLAWNRTSSPFTTAAASAAPGLRTTLSILLACQQMGETFSMFPSSKGTGANPRNKPWVPLPSFYFVPLRRPTRRDPLPHLEESGGWSFYDPSAGVLHGLAYWS